MMAEPLADRRKRLEDLLGGVAQTLQCQLVPAFDNARHLWATWVVPRVARGSS
jgi:hypothetical protein